MKKFHKEQPDISNLFTVESFGRVERLNERRRVSDEERVANGAGQHADHGQPDVGQALRRVPAVTNTQHVRQRLKQRPRVLLCPVRALYRCVNTRQVRLDRCRLPCTTSIHL